MADRQQGTESRGRLFDKWSDGVGFQILGLEAIGDAAEIPQPSPGLRQRYADMPAAALARLARPRHHRAERHQIAGGVIEHLRRPFLRPTDAGSLPFGMVESGLALHP